MKLKANFHLHSSEDSHDVLDYSIYEAVDKAAEFGFKILAWTPHDEVLCEKKHIEYAAAKEIILIPGIEKMVEGKEVLIINANKKAEEIKNFSDLRKYKEEQGKEVLLIAPHPFFPAFEALGAKLLKNIDLFDLVENSWFYLKNINFNEKALKIAKKFNKPFIATSDTHELKYLNNSYCLLESENNISGILSVLRAGNFENFSQPISLFTASNFYYKIVLRPKVLFVKLLRMFKKGRKL